MRSPYGLDTRDKNAAWIFIGSDLVLVLIACTTPEDYRAGFSFWAPLLLLVLNVVIAAIVFRESKRKSITFLLAAWLGVAAGMTGGLLYYTSDAASLASSHDANYVGATLLYAWSVPLLGMLIAYIAMLRNRGE